MAACATDTLSITATLSVTSVVTSIFSQRYKRQLEKSHKFTYCFLKDRIKISAQLNNANYCP